MLYRSDSPAFTGAEMVSKFPRLGWTAAGRSSGGRCSRSPAGAGGTRRPRGPPAPLGVGGVVVKNAKSVGVSVLETPTRQLETLLHLRETPKRQRFGARNAVQTPFVGVYDIYGRR